MNGYIGVVVRLFGSVGDAVHKRHCAYKICKLELTLDGFAGLLPARKVFECGVDLGVGQGHILYSIQDPKTKVLRSPSAHWLKLSQLGSLRMTPSERNGRGYTVAFAVRCG